MQLELAKKQVLDLIHEDIINKNLSVAIDATPPDRDPGKFLLEAKPARVIAPFDGFFVNINLGWFDESKALPKIQRGEFYWYVFALLSGKKDQISDYYICDYLKMRAFVLDFKPAAKYGYRDHKDHPDWRGSIEIVGSDKALIRWGDEPIGDYNDSRLINLNNIVEIKRLRSSISYKPTKNDYIKAYTEIAKLGEEVSIDHILDQIESFALTSDRNLINNWRQITEKKILEEWNK